MTVQLTYLDTSALMRRAEGLAQTCTQRNSLIAPVIEGILEDSNRLLACSEFTLVEFHTNVTSNWRSTVLPDCDERWWELALADLLDRIAEGRIAVIPTPVKAVERAMALVTVATRDHGRALRAWDALHFVVASSWGLSEGSDVELITSDSDFSVTLDLVGVSGRVHLLNLDVAAGTGEGADRRTVKVQS